MKTYNKLIRDHIPKIIKDAGKTCKVRILNDEEYKASLKEKLIEESNELLEAVSIEAIIEELADVEELISHIKRVYQIDNKTLKIMRDKKNKSNGSFHKQLFLETVDD